MMLRSLLLGLWLATGSVPPAYAQSAEDFSSGRDEPSYVARPIMHAERVPAEICLQFDRMLDASLSAARVAAQMRLELDDKNVPVPRKSVSLGGDQICLTGLDHRRSYRLSLEALRNARDEKITRAYNLSFAIPARRPALSFTGQEVRDGVERADHLPALTSINVPKATVELHQITSPAKMAEAWNGRLQAGLAPAESLYLARHEGAEIWKQDVQPEALSDRGVTTPVAGDGKDLPPGLYLLAATAPEAEIKVTHGDRDDTEKMVGLTPTSAIWLLRSNLSLHAVVDGGVVTALVERDKAFIPPAGVHVYAFDRDQNPLAEGLTDASGAVALHVKGSQPVHTLVAVGEGGNAAFAVLDGLPPVERRPAQIATLAVDQDYYQPGETVSFAATLHDLRKHAQNSRGSRLEILRGDGSVYDTRSVTQDGTGVAHATTPAPAVAGIWRAVWRAEDGHTLAETSFRVSPNNALSRIEVKADRTTVGAESSLVLTVGSTLESNHPAPFVSGAVELRWRKADHPFAAWKDYRFDDGAAPDTAPLIVARFVTDEKGRATVPLTLPVPDHRAALEAELRVVSDPVQDAIESQPLRIMVKASGPVVGISAHGPGRQVPENSVARFDAQMLDTEGRPVAADDLTYQIYEMGRRFDWFQADGTWDYKPETQKRRVGGGSVAFDDHGHAQIESPVLSGAYRLEISDSDGRVLALYDFNAGWDAPADAAAPPDDLTLKASGNVVQAGMAQGLTFRLPEAAAVTVTIADEQVRAVQHSTHPAGDATISWTPAADWGGQLVVVVEAHGASGKIYRGRLLVPAAVETVPLHTAKTVVTHAQLTENDRALRDASGHVLPPRDALTIPAVKTRKDGDPVVWIAPLPVEGLAAALTDLVHRHPVATAELAGGVRAVSASRDLMAASGLLSDADSRAMVKDGLSRLLARQNGDGGFGLVPGDRSSDLMATAAALEAMTGADENFVPAAREQAVRWLQRRLENTWFDDKERPLRARAYAALARAGRLDAASLHYFSDTSAEKTVTAELAVQLAYAFFAMNDRPASSYWLDRFATAEDQTLRAATVEYLIRNAYAANDLVRRAYQSFTRENGAALAHWHGLLSFWAMAERYPARVTIDGVEKTIGGVLALAVTDKDIQIKNTDADASLAVHTVVAARRTRGGKIQRRIYTLSGSEAVGTLNRNGAYVVVLGGTWPAGQSSLRVHENPQPYLTPLGCAFQPSGDFAVWLDRAALAHVRGCDLGAGGIDILLARESNAGDAWRVAYIARARDGDARRIPPPEMAVSPDDKDGPR